jgi:hypothetical protein
MDMNYMKQNERFFYEAGANSKAFLTFSLSMHGEGKLSDISKMLTM